VYEQPGDLNSLGVLVWVLQRKE